MNQGVRVTKDLILMAVQETRDDPHQVVCWYQDHDEVSCCELLDLPEVDLDCCLAVSYSHVYQQIHLSGHILVRTNSLDHPDLNARV